ncbi:hypothetical protein DPMN_013662 [Dreissena polymorpha]|uniref:Uncharacterized protein n=1 Tax=Dreissena polymorpha TaxID=45954 RepID=A0A9D4S3Z0_DREPO|nr:hypothetical protein DPMN_013662 [Dreissena polymorpha]
MKSSRHRRTAHKMARVALWAVLVFLVALFVSYFLDSNIPEDIPETWKVRFMDAAMRTYKCLVREI